MRPTREEIVSIWRYLYARSAFIDAAEYLNAYESADHTTGLGQTFARASLCAAIIAYARPFTMSQIAAGRKREQPISHPPPSDLAEAHRLALKFRDRIYGHKDATPAEGDQITPNIIVLERHEGGFVIHAREPLKLDAWCVAQLKLLSSYFGAYCYSQMQPIVTKYNAEILTHPNGQYELRAADDSDPWLIPITPPTDPVP